jgi:hypothetical protein
VRTTGLLLKLAEDPDADAWPTIWSRALALPGLDPALRTAVALQGLDWLAAHVASPAAAEVWPRLLRVREWLPASRRAAVPELAVTWLHAHDDHPDWSALVLQLLGLDVELAPLVRAALHHRALAWCERHDGPTASGPLLTGLVHQRGTLAEEHRERLWSLALFALKSDRATLGWTDLWETLYAARADLPPRIRAKLVARGLAAFEHGCDDPRRLRVHRHALALVAEEVAGGEDLVARLRRVAEDPDHPNWLPVLVALLRGTVPTPLPVKQELVGVALRFLRDHPDHPRFPDAWVVLQRRFRAPLPPELDETGRAFLRARADHPRWPKVWRRLAARGVDAEVDRLARDWLGGHLGAPDAEPIFRRLAGEVDGFDAELAELGERWIARNRARFVGAGTVIRVVPLVEDPDRRAALARSALALLPGARALTWANHVLDLVKVAHLLPPDVVGELFRAVASPPEGAPPRRVERAQAQLLAWSAAHAPRPEPVHEPLLGWTWREVDGRAEVVRETIDGQVRARAVRCPEGWALEAVRHGVKVPEVKPSGQLRAALYLLDILFQKTGEPVPAPRDAVVSLPDGRPCDPDHLDDQVDADRLVRAYGFAWAAAEVAAGRSVRRLAWPRTRTWSARQVGRVGTADVSAEDWVRVGVEGFDPDHVRGKVREYQHTAHRRSELERTEPDLSPAVERDG